MKTLLLFTSKTILPDIIDRLAENTHYFQNPLASGIAPRTSKLSLGNFINLSIISYVSILPPKIENLS